MVRPKIKVGVFADSLTQPYWLCQSISEIARSEFAEITLIAEITGPGTQEEVKEKKAGWVRHGLFRAYCAIDKHLFGAFPDPLALTSLPLFPKAAKLHLQLSREGGLIGDNVSINAYGLDVLLWFSDAVPPREINLISRQGVWQLFIGTVSSAGAGIAGFWEVMLGQESTISGIRLLSGDVDQRMIYLSSARTFHYSFRKNQENVLRKTTEFIHRKLKDFYYRGERALEKQDDGGRPQAPLPATIPGNLRMLILLVRLTARVVHRSLQKLLFVEQWILAYRFGGEPDIDDIGALSGFKRLLPPRDRFWADPFPIKKDGHYFIFFEELLFSTGKGHISVVELDPKGYWSVPRKVLEEKYHLSYPFLFEWNGVLYMVPESGADNCIRLYRCVCFPDRWEFDQVLIDNLRAVDATLHCIDNRWWMFANISPPGVEIYDELHLYYAETPLGPWFPHRCNPVISNVKSARPAGRVFEKANRLLRPAQVCVPIYGAGLSFNEIVCITPENYAEREILKVSGQQVKALGLHTWNEADGLCAIDYFVRRSRLF